MSQRQLITFQLGDELLGVDIMAVREIRAWSAATPLPNAPAHVRGVVNLRGVVLPVLDLRQLLGWGCTEPTARHVIIVVQVGTKLQGLVVDAVNDITTIELAAIQAPPELGNPALARMIDGIATSQEQMITVLSLDCLESGGDRMLEAA